MSDGRFRFTTTAKNLGRNSELQWGGVNGWVEDLDEVNGVNIEDGSVRPLSGVDSVEWVTEEDWDAAQSESNVVHRSYPGDARTAASISIGYDVNWLPRPTRIVGYWPLDETEGTVASDVVNNEAGSFSPGDVTVGHSGPLGSNAYHFTGSGGITLPFTATDAFSTGEFAMAGWFNFDWLESATGGSGQLLFYGYNHNDNPNDIRWEVGQQGNGIVVWNHGQTSDHTVADGVLSAGTWHYISCHLTDSGEVQIWVDQSKERDRSDVASHPLDGGTQSCTIGEKNTGTSADDHLAGYASDVLIWNSKLSDAEHEALHNVRTGGELVTAMKSP